MSERRATMRLLRIGLIGWICSGVLASALTSLAQSVHVVEALQHVQAAIAQGKQGYPDALAVQAREALKHAEMAKKEIPSPHLNEGIQALKEALEKVKAGQTEAATKAAEEALRHLSLVNPATAGTPPEDGY